MTSSLTSTSEGETLILTISNPEFKNALSPEIYSAGIEALNAFETHSEIRSVVITGAGAAFCAGGNLQRLLANRQQPKAMQAQSIDGLHSFIDSIRSYPKPIIAAVEGAAAGAGFSLALACDFCVAADNAVFVMSYSSVGLSPDGGGSWSLARSLPRQLAMQLMMCGDRISAQRLHGFGLVNQVCGSGKALQEALALAARLNARATNALSSIKELVNDAAGQSLGQHLTQERDHFVENLHNSNAEEGINAFLQKRVPTYR